MKNYIKPRIEVVAIASSMPIAYKSCTGDNRDDYDYVRTWDEYNKSETNLCVNYEWIRNS